jgi:hypothetical protein
MSQRFQKKQIFISFLMFLLLGPFAPAASPAGDGNSVTILYTGSVRGAIDPIHA